MASETQGNVILSMQESIRDVTMGRDGNQSLLGFQSGATFSLLQHQFFASHSSPYIPYIVSHGPARIVSNDHLCRRLSLLEVTCSIIRSRNEDVVS